MSLPLRKSFMCLGSRSSHPSFFEKEGLIVEKDSKLLERGFGLVMDGVVELFARPRCDLKLSKPKFVLARRSIAFEAELSFLGSESNASCEDCISSFNS